MFEVSENGQQETLADRLIIILCRLKNVHISDPLNSTLAFCVTLHALERPSFPPGMYGA